MTRTELREGFFLGDRQIEPRLGRVSRTGHVGQLEPKVMDVLVLLAESYPRVVSRGEFFDAIWHDVHVVEHVLPRAISEIRRQFEDDPRDPFVIETIPKLGYRLMLEPVPPPEPARAPYRRSSSAQNKIRKYLPLVVSFAGGALTLLLLLLVIGFWITAGGPSHHHRAIHGQASR